MKRRALIRNIGAAGIATAALSGSTAAQRPSIGDLDIERELDVSSVEGWVTLDELLEPDELRALPTHLDPSERLLTVAPEADTITIQDCCAVCCNRQLIDCGCNCCGCDFVEGCTDA